MAGTVVKVAGGAAATGTGTGAVGYGVYDYCTYTLEYLIKGEHIAVKFLKNKDNIDQIKALIRSYRSASDDKKFKSLDVGTGDTEPTDDQVNSFLNKCLELKNLSVRFSGNVDDLKSKVKNWCTEIDNVRDGLSREGKEAIKEESGDTDATWKSLFPSSDQTGFKTFLGVESPSAENHVSNLKEKCKTALETKPGSSYSSKLTDSRKYCVPTSRVS